MLQIPELLAPAGDAERLRYAINYGADAVYCGLNLVCALPRLISPRSS